MNGSPALAHPLLADPAYPPLKDRLIAATGLAYYAEKDGELAGRLARRLAETDCADCTAYLALLADGQRGEAELDALIADLTIGETFFFRHRELFEALRDVVLPDLLARNQQSRTLRIWSAGCATGAEPYSLAILLRRDLAPRTAGWNVAIVGTDVNRDFLARARAGVFEEWAFRATPEELKRACFTPVGNSWCINPEFKEVVSFQYHNLATHPFPSLLDNLFAFDLILCRNVTIYFSLDIVRRIVGHFHQSLVEGGWLLVGHAEPNLELYRSFRTVNVPGAVLYQKSKEPAPAPAWFAPPPATKTEFAGLLPPSSAFLPPPLPADPPLAGPADLDAVRRYADRGAWDRAAACCEEVLARDRLNPSVHFYRALVLEQMGRHNEAEQALRRVIYLDRAFVLGHYYLGLLLQKMGQRVQAVRAFRNAQHLLTRIPAEQVFADGDGITAGELAKRTQRYLDILEGT